MHNLVFLSHIFDISTESVCFHGSIQDFQGCPFVVLHQKKQLRLQSWGLLLWEQISVPHSAQLRIYLHIPPGGAQGPMITHSLPFPSPANTGTSSGNDSLHQPWPSWVVKAAVLRPLKDSTGLFKGKSDPWTPM